MGWLLLVFLILLALAAIPVWPYSRSWSLFPSISAFVVAGLTLLLLGLGYLD